MLPNLQQVSPKVQKIQRFMNFWLYIAFAMRYTAPRSVSCADTSRELPSSTGYALKHIITIKTTYYTQNYEITLTKDAAHRSTGGRGR